MGFGRTSCGAWLSPALSPLPCFQAWFSSSSSPARLVYWSVVGGAGSLRAGAQAWIVISQDLQAYTGIRNSCLLRMKLVANRGLVGANQEIICSWGAEEFGNMPSSSAGGLGVMSQRQGWDLGAVCEGRAVGCGVPLGQSLGVEGGPAVWRAGSRHLARFLGGAVPRPWAAAGAVVLLRR